jgi:hypothetical protein
MKFENYRKALIELCCAAGLEIPSEKEIEEEFLNEVKGGEKCQPHLKE